MPEYSNTIIYKIVCNDLTITDCYVGHTTNFTKRKHQHKENCNMTTSKHYNYKIYTTIRSIGGWINWSIIEIEKFPCLDANEARARERHWYELNNSTLNSRQPLGPSATEYYIQHKAEKLIYDQQRNSFKQECECGGRYSAKYKPAHLRCKKHVNFLSLPSSK
jgi:hypothetical protein